MTASTARTDDATLAQWDAWIQSGARTAQEIADECGLAGKNAVLNRLRRWRKRRPTETAPEPEPEPAPDDPEAPLTHPATGRPVTDQKGDIIFADRRPEPTDQDTEKLLQAYLSVMEAARLFHTSQQSARVTIQGNMPVGLVHFGDPHIGAWGWAAQRMLDDWRIAAEEDGLFVNFLGDEIDNFIFHFAKWASVMPPGHQRRIMHYLCGKLRDKVVAMVLGNHLHWTKKVADIDYTQELAWLDKAVYLGHGGDLHVTVGSQTYHGYLRHKARGSSALNKANSARRTSDDIGGADFSVEAHLHDPWMHMEYKARKRQIWMRTGTYKLADDHAEAEGFAPAHCDMPMLILYPDQKLVLPFWDFRHGLSTLRAERAAYRARLEHQEVSA